MPKIVLLAIVTFVLATGLAQATDTPAPCAFGPDLSLEAEDALVLTPVDAPPAETEPLAMTCSSQCGQQYVQCGNACGSDPLCSVRCEGWYCQCLQGCGQFCY